MTQTYLALMSSYISLRLISVTAYRSAHKAYEGFDIFVGPVLARILIGPTMQHHKAHDKLDWFLPAANHLHKFQHSRLDGLSM